MFGAKFKAFDPEQFGGDMSGLCAVIVLEVYPLIVQMGTRPICSGSDSAPAF